MGRSGSNVGRTLSSRTARILWQFRRNGFTRRHHSVEPGLSHFLERGDAGTVRQLGVADTIPASSILVAVGMWVVLASLRVQVLPSCCACKARDECRSSTYFETMPDSSCWPPAATFPLAPRLHCDRLLRVLRDAGAAIFIENYAAGPYHCGCPVRLPHSDIRYSIGSFGPAATDAMGAWPAGPRIVPVFSSNRYEVDSADAARAVWNSVAARRLCRSSGRSVLRAISNSRAL